LKEKIANIEIEYQSDKKEKKILLLNKENKLKIEKIKGRNLFILVLILSLFIVLGIAYFLRQRGKEKLQLMSSEIQMFVLKINNLNADKIEKQEIYTIDFLNKYDLTERETEVLNFISKGMSNTSIAENIFVSKNTVKYHIKNIYLKLDVKNRVEALNKLNQN